MRRRGSKGSMYRRMDRGGDWWIRVRLGAGGALMEYRRKVGPDEADARVELARVLKDISEGIDPREDAAEPVPDGSTLTLASWMDTYLSMARPTLSPKEGDKRESQLRRMVEFLPGPMAETTTGDVRSALARLRAHGASAATANRYRAALSAAYRYAVECGAIASNPCRGVRAAREATDEPPWLSDEDLDRIALATPAKYRPLVQFCHDTGLRLGEALALTWRNVDLDRGVVQVAASTSKSGRSRMVDLTSLARAALVGLPRGGRVFAGIASSTVSRRFPTWATAAGFPGVTFHDLRHAFCSRLAQKGIPLTDIQRLAGHASITVTMRYARHAPTDASAAAIRSLERAPSKGTTKRRAATK